MKVVLIVLLVLVVLYACAILFLYTVQERMIMHPKALHSDYQYSFTHGHSFTEHFIPVDGKVVLNILHFTPGSESKGIVIYFHGNTGEVNAWGEEAVHFLERGYDVLMPDFRGYGKSTGKVNSEQDLIDDAEATYLFANTHFADKDLYFYGRSLGSGIAAILARKYTPKALLLETPYNSMLDVVKHHVPYVPVSLILKYRLRTDKILPQVECPVYAIHGTYDPTIPYELAAKLKDIPNVDMHFYTAEQAQHNNLKEYWEFGQMLDDALGAK